MPEDFDEHLCLSSTIKDLCSLLPVISSLLEGFVHSDYIGKYDWQSLVTYVRKTDRTSGAEHVGGDFDSNGAEYSIESGVEKDILRFLEFVEGKFVSFTSINVLVDWAFEYGSRRVSCMSSLDSRFREHLEFSRVRRHTRSKMSISGGFARRELFYENMPGGDKEDAELLSRFNPAFVYFVDLEYYGHCMKNFVDDCKLKLKERLEIFDSYSAKCGFELNKLLEKWRSEGTDSFLSPDNVGNSCVISDSLRCILHSQSLVILCSILVTSEAWLIEIQSRRISLWSRLLLTYNSHDTLDSMRTFWDATFSDMMNNIEIARTHLDAWGFDIERAREWCLSGMDHLRQLSTLVNEVGDMCYSQTGIPDGAAELKYLFKIFICDQKGDLEVGAPELLRDTENLGNSSSVECTKVLSLLNLGGAAINVLLESVAGNCSRFSRDVKEDNVVDFMVNSNNAYFCLGLIDAAERHNNLLRELLSGECVGVCESVDLCHGTAACEQDSAEYEVFSVRMRSPIKLADVGRFFVPEYTRYFSEVGDDEDRFATNVRFNWKGNFGYGAHEVKVIAQNYNVPMHHFMVAATELAAKVNSYGDKVSLITQASIEVILQEIASSFETMLSCCDEQSGPDFSHDAESMMRGLVIVRELVISSCIAASRKRGELLAAAECVIRSILEHEYKRKQTTDLPKRYLHDYDYILQFRTKRAEVLAALDLGGRDEINGILDEVRQLDDSVNAWNDKVGELCRELQTFYRSVPLVKCVWQNRRRFVELSYCLEQQSNASVGLKLFNIFHVAHRLIDIFCKNTQVKVARMANQYLSVSPKLNQDYEFFLSFTNEVRALEADIVNSGLYWNYDPVMKLPRVIKFSTQLDVVNNLEVSFVLPKLHDFFNMNKTLYFSPEGRKIQSFDMFKLFRDINFLPVYSNILSIRANIASRIKSLEMEYKSWCMRENVDVRSYGRMMRAAITDAYFLAISLSGRVLHVNVGDMAVAHKSVMSAAADKGFGGRYSYYRKLVTPKSISATERDVSVQGSTSLGVESLNRMVLLSSRSSIVSKLLQLDLGKNMHFWVDCVVRDSSVSFFSMPELQEVCYGGLILSSVLREGRDAAMVKIRSVDTKARAHVSYACALESFCDNPDKPISRVLFKGLMELMSDAFPARDTCPLHFDSLLSVYEAGLTSRPARHLYISPLIGRQALLEYIYGAKRSFYASKSDFIVMFANRELGQSMINSIRDVSIKVSCPPTVDLAACRDFPAYLVCVFLRLGLRLGERAFGGAFGYEFTNSEHVLQKKSYFDVVDSVLLLSSPQMKASDVVSKSRIAFLLRHLGTVFLSVEFLKLVVRSDLSFLRALKTVDRNKEVSYRQKLESFGSALQSVVTTCNKVSMLLQYSFNILTGIGNVVGALEYLQSAEFLQDVAADQDLRLIRRDGLMSKAHDMHHKVSKYAATTLIVKSCNEFKKLCEECSKVCDFSSDFSENGVPEPRSVLLNLLKKLKYEVVLRDLVEGLEIVGNASSMMGSMVASACLSVALDDNPDIDGRMKFSKVEIVDACNPVSSFCDMLITELDGRDDKVCGTFAGNAASMPLLLQCDLVRVLLDNFINRAGLDILDDFTKLEQEAYSEFMTAISRRNEWSDGVFSECSRLVKNFLADKNIVRTGPFDRTDECEGLKLDDNDHVVAHTINSSVERVVAGTDRPISIQHS